MSANGRQIKHILQRSKAELNFIPPTNFISKHSLVTKQVNFTLKEVNKMALGFEVILKRVNKI